MLERLLRDPIEEELLRTVEAIPKWMPTLTNAWACLDCGVIAPFTSKFGRCTTCYSESVFDVAKALAKEEKNSEAGEGASGLQTGSGSAPLSEDS